MKKEKNKVAFIIQARMGSSRLPHKIVLPFYEGRSILELLIEKFSSFSEVPVIVATTASAENDGLVSFLNDREIPVFRGSENDVLDRFIRAAEYFQVDRLIRVCSDNPFLEKKAIAELIRYAERSNADYIGFKVNGQPSIKTHFGFWTEFVTADALKRVRQSTEESLFHEHVTNYIYTHPDQFQIEWLDTPFLLQGRYDIRFTIDTPDDFKNVQRIYSEIVNPSEATIETLVRYLGEHPDCLTLMKKEILKNEK